MQDGKDAMAIVQRRAGGLFTFQEAHDRDVENFWKQGVIQGSPTGKLPAAGTTAVDHWNVMQGASVGGAGRKVWQQRNHDLENHEQANPVSLTSGNGIRQD